MKILHVTPVYLPATEWGGPVVTLAALVHGQQELGNRVAVVTTNARGSAALPAHPAGEHRVDGIRAFYHPARLSRRFAYAPGLAADLTSRIPDHDIVHIHGLWTYPSAAAARACSSSSRPYVVTLHGMLLKWALTRKSLKKRLYRLLVQDRSLLGAAALHCTSIQEQREIPERYRRVPSVVLPNPIELDDLLQVPEGDFTSRPFRLLICGRIHPVKGFDHLVPALARVRRKGLDVRLAVAGGDEGGYRGDVERLAREHAVHDALEFRGNLEWPDLLQAYAEAAALVMPSYQENFGMSAAEAMAAARPVVVSRGVNIAGDIRSAPAGLVTGLDADEIAGAILELAADPDRCRRLGENGRRFVRERYSPRAVAAGMVEAYGRILAG